MQLRLNKSQRTSLVKRNVIFALAAQVELTAEEAAYVKKYKLGKDIIYYKQRVLPKLKDFTNFKAAFQNLASAATTLKITVTDLTKGRTVECKDIAEMLEVQEQITTACQTLKDWLVACATFEGEEILEF